jgi:hypothetical protein
MTTLLPPGTTDRAEPADPGSVRGGAPEPARVPPVAVPRKVFTTPLLTEAEQTMATDQAAWYPLVLLGQGLLPNLL